MRNHANEHYQENPVWDGHGPVPNLPGMGCRWQKMASKSFRTLKEAKAWEASTQKAVNEDAYIRRPQRLRCQSSSRDWAEKSARIKLKVQTVELYEALPPGIIEPHIGKLPLQNVTPLAIQAVYAYSTGGAKPISAQDEERAYGPA